MERAEHSAIDDSLLRQCVHCGLCLDACPTYVELGNEADSPRGRIHLATALAGGDLELSDEAVRHFDLCLGCRACETACPSGVPYGRIIEETRAHIEARHRRSWLDRLRRSAVLAVFPHRGRLAWLTRLVRALQLVGLWPLVRRLVPAARLFPKLSAGQPLRSSEPDGEAVRRVGFLRGCVSDVVQPQVNAAAARVLRRARVAVDVAAGQGCCGALHLHAGDVDQARRLARANIDAFDGRELDAVVVTAAGCGAAMREYGELLRDDPAYRERAARFAARVRDVTELVEPLLPESGGGQGAGRRVTYHDACHLAHAQGVRSQPRALLSRIAGWQLVELEESDRCCGSAGSYNLTEPEMAAALAMRKVDCIERSGADCVAVANPGCALQIAAELRRRGNPMRVAHPLELVDESLAARSE